MTYPQEKSEKVTMSILFNGKALAVDNSLLLKTLILL
jgi:hypothetical protein